MTEKTKISQEQIDKYLANMIATNPVKVLGWMLVVMGRDMLSANAETMDLKTEADLETGKRFEIKCKCKIRKIKSLKQ